MIVIKSLESDTIAQLVSPARSRISTMLHLAVVTRVEAADAAGGGGKKTLTFEFN